MFIYLLNKFATIKFSTDIKFISNIYFKKYYYLYLKSGKHGKNNAS